MKPRNTGVLVYYNEDTLKASMRPGHEAPEYPANDGASTGTVDG